MVCMIGRDVVRSDVMNPWFEIEYDEPIFLHEEIWLLRDLLNIVMM